MYCNQCGNKNSLGSKFCSSCGKPILSAASILNAKPIKKKFREEESDQHDEDDSDEESERFEMPEKLSYSIEMPKTTLKLGDIIGTQESKEPQARVVNYTKLSKEEFFRESMKACGPSKQPKEIDETS